MRNIIILMAGLFFMFSCSNSTPEEKKAESVTVDEFLSNPEQYVDQEVTVTGLVTHVCKHGGQKLFIVGNDDAASLRVNTSEDIPEFGIELEGSRAGFTGVVKLMDEEFIAAAIAEENEHHPEAETEEGHSPEELANRNKEYYIVASSYETVE